MFVEDGQEEQMDTDVKSVSGLRCHYDNNIITMMTIIMTDRPLF